MPSYVIEPPKRPRLARRVALGALAACIAAVLVVGWMTSRTVRVVIDGRETSVAAGTTVADLLERAAFSAKDGDLIGVDGAVLVAGGGGAMGVQRNGDAAPLYQRVYDGDRLTSHSGADERETIEVTQTAIPFETRYEGNGSLAEIRRLGAPGVLSVTRGRVSGIEITSTVLTEPVDTLIMRTRPGRGEKVVALTFDDGPWPGSTARILALLDKHKVRATFFLLGVQARRLPSVARSVRQHGHLIGNHSLDHKVFSVLTDAEVRREIRGGNQYILHTTSRGTNFLRPPYGAMDAQAWREAWRLRQHVVMWDVDSRDWTKPGTKVIVRNVVSHVRPGSVVLMHDGGGDRRQTVAALEQIIRQLRAKGYRFVTVDELAWGPAKSGAVKNPPRRR